MRKKYEGNKVLGLKELIAISLGGMIGGGIFTVLGISVSIIHSLTPVAMVLGSLLALLASYSYIKLGLYYKDKGATYAFFKRSYPKSHTAPSVIGWLVIFSYISTISLYAYTFSSYVLSSTPFSGDVGIRKVVAIIVIIVFTLINTWNVKGMGKIEDIMVYTKLVILFIISVILIYNGGGNLGEFISSIKSDFSSVPLIGILVVSSITFVAYEGFQLVINAEDEMKKPEKNIPKAIYISIILAMLIYIIISVGALLAIPEKDIIAKKEFALAAGAGSIMGWAGTALVIIGAVLATSSAINGTLFGSARQMQEIASDGYLPKKLGESKSFIPVYSIIAISFVAIVLIVTGTLQLLLEFGSITFLLISLLMAITNFKIRKKTNSNTFVTALAIFALIPGSILILWYEFTYALHQMIYILVLYIIIGIGSVMFARKRKKKSLLEKNGKKDKKD